MRRQEQAQQRIRDIEPTIGGGSFNDNRGGGRNAAAAQNQRSPLALQAANDRPAPQRAAAAPTQAQAAARVHRAPRQAANKPAKAG